jgi:hypothetical protein
LGKEIRQHCVKWTELGNLKKCKQGTGKENPNLGNDKEWGEGEKIQQEKNPGLPPSRATHFPHFTAA